MILGTAAYMSPEQARGKLVDKRADIWAFGCVFYEMLTGRRAFAGDSVSDTLVAVLTAGVDFDGLPADTPPAVRRLLRHCLERESKGRLRDIADGLLELQEGREYRNHEFATPRTARSRPAPRQVMPRVWTLGFSALGVVTLAAVVGYWLWPHPQVADAILSLANPVQVTRSQGLVTSLAWSPNGSTLAYQLRNTQITSDIWVSPIGGEPLNRTADYSGFHGEPVWSPDGREIAFRSTRDGGGIFVMSALAGAPRKVSTAVASAPANPNWGSGFPRWLAEGTALAYVVHRERGTDGTRADIFLEILTLSSGDTRRLPLPGEMSDRRQLRWSPNEELLAYVEGVCETCHPSRVWLMRMADGEAAPITDVAFNHSPSWSPDGRTLYFVSNRGGGRDLWQQRVSAAGRPMGEAVRVTVGVRMYRAALSPDGTKLACVQGGPTSNLWRVPISPDRVAYWRDAEPLTFDVAEVRMGDVSSDGTRLVFRSDRGGSPDLWMLPVAGGEMQQLTSDPAQEINAVWSPDDKQLAFSRYDDTGSRKLWVMPVSGGTARQLTMNDDVEPSWSPDGKEIVFRSTRGGDVDIWIVNVETGDLRPLVEHPGRDDWPRWSPDGRSVIFGRDGLVWRILSTGGEANVLTTADGGLMWSPDGGEIYYLHDTDYWALSIDDGSERRLTEFSGRPGGINEDIGRTDGRYLYFQWNVDQGDIWAMDVVQAESGSH